MIKYLKENGFPMTVHIDTVEDVSPEDSTKVYNSVFMDEKGDIIHELMHVELHGRITWIGGFFAGLTYKQNETKG